MRPVNAELISILVSQPVEANGILSRIEQHVAVLRDFHHAAFSKDGSALAILLLHACHWQYDHALELLREVHLERQKANAP
jgi:hypothetical protein